MKLTQLLEALDKRGIGEALLRGGEAMQTRVDGEWKPQGAVMPIGALGAMIEAGAPAEAVAQWQSESRCQFEQDGFLIKAAHSADRVQIAVKRAQVSVSPFAPASSSGAPQTTTFAPTAAPVATVAPVAAKAPQSALKPAVAEWYYLDESAEKGPIAPDRVRALISTGTIGGDTMVWSDGMTDWRNARDSDLRSLLPSNALNPVSSAPPLSPVAPIAAPRGDIKPGRIGGDRIHEIPASHDKFSLGAFTMPLFWCMSNGQSSRFWPILWTGFIPFVGGLVSLYLTFQLASEANSLAWLSRDWNSAEHFDKTQKVWTIVGAVVLVLYVVLFFVGVFAGGD